MPAPRPSARSGCLSGCLMRAILFLVLGVVFVALVQAVFAPWGYYLGGHFHLVPTWQGWGRMHTPTGRDYVVFVRVFPSPRGSRMGFANLSGIGYLCTPRHEEIRMNLGGTMDKHLGRDTQGQWVHLYMYHRPFFSLSAERRPGLEIYGTWGDEQVSGDDHGSLGRAFNPDDTVYLGRAPDRRPSFGPVQVTLRAGAKRDFDAACSAR